jgi:DNA-binding transcriptional LysR family regulator
MTGSQRWAALEIRLISAFVAVVEKGSFAAAARELGYTQSGVSQQVAALERILDCKLLIRHAGGRRPVQPTPEGAEFLEHARALLARIDRAYDAVHGRAQGLDSAVRLVAYPSIAVHILPDLLRELRSRTSVRVEILAARNEDELFEHLDSGSADVGFSVLPAPERFVAEELGADTYVAVVPADSRLGLQTQISLADLKGRSLLGIVRGAHEDVVETRLAAAGLEGVTVDRYDDNQVVQSLVAGGHGVAIVPWLTADVHDAAVRVVPLGFELPPRRIGLVHHRDRLLPPAAREFRTVAVDVCRALLRRPDVEAQAS